jgi:hypothetical protein
MSRLAASTRLMGLHLSITLGCRTRSRGINPPTACHNTDQIELRRSADARGLDLSQQPLQSGKVLLVVAAQIVHQAAQ